MMAKRPIFIPIDSFPFVERVQVEFKWFPGFSKNQIAKSILSLHESAAQLGIHPILEISSKSPEALGVSLSAFNLKISFSDMNPISVECAFQGSKVFQMGGPYNDLYCVSSREAKTDKRIRSSGRLVEFSLFGNKFPVEPVNAFYDWLYIVALSQNSELSCRLVDFRGFSDIVFNPNKSSNCQARSAALFVSLDRLGQIESVVRDRDYYLSLITGKQPK